MMKNASLRDIQKVVSQLHASFRVFFHSLLLYRAILLFFILGQKLWLRVGLVKPLLGELDGSSEGNLRV